VKNFNRIEINIKGPKDGQEMSCFLPWNANIEEWKDVFKTILTHQTFAPETIKDLFFNEEDNSSEYEY
jgi:hypothetical protein